MTVYNWSSMSPRERDALVAEKVMGIALKPHSDIAKVKVAWKHIRVTGRFFKLDDQNEVEVPDGSLLPQPTGSSDWNDRYALYVANKMESKWRDEIEAYRIQPREYTTDISAAWEVVEKIRNIKNEKTVWNGYEYVEVPKYELTLNSLDDATSDKWICGVWESQRDFRQREADYRGYAPTAPEAICLAALRAVGVDIQ